MERLGELEKKKITKALVVGTKVYFYYVEGKNLCQGSVELDFLEISDTESSVMACELKVPYDPYARVQQRKFHYEKLLVNLDDIQYAVR